MTDEGPATVPRPAAEAEPPPPPEAWTRRFQARRNELSAAQGREGRLGSIGTLVFLLWGAVLVVLAARSEPLGSAVVVGAFVVAAMVAWRKRWTARALVAGIRVDWMERAAERRRDRYDFGQGDGSEWMERGHAFAYDLDLFGPASLYFRMNACHTLLGREALADILTDDGPGDSAISRQAAVREMTTQIDLREGLEVELRLLSDRAGRAGARGLDDLERNTRQVFAWGAEPGTEPPRWQPYAYGVLGLVAVTALAAVFVANVSWWWLAPPLLVNGWVQRRHPDLGSLTRQFDRVRTTLEPWSRVLAQLEEARVSSSLLTELYDRVRRGSGARPSGEAASGAVRRLGRLAHHLSQRRNAFWALTGNLFLVWDLHARHRLLVWRARHGRDLEPWLRAAADFEAFSALAAWSESQWDAAWPSLESDGPLFQAKGLGHPLLPRDRRVANDCSLQDPGALWIVTGSNMSGKSTFLRSVGLAVVLSNAGLPVPARSLRLRPLRVVTSMKVEESLVQGTSRFYAEVRRLRKCLDWAGGEGSTLVLLDEILAGTNSRERSIGTAAVLATLVGMRTAILVSTHDLEMARAHENDPAARVVHFRDQVQDGRMFFDYRLRDGALPSTNALEVMRLAGIDVPTSPRSEGPRP